MPRGMPRRALPEDRERLCKACTALRAAGRGIRVYCKACINMNAYVYDDDDPVLVRLRAELAEAKKKKMAKGPGQMRRYTVEKLTKAQRGLYGAKLTFYLARAKMRGKRVDGRHANPYKWAAIKYALGIASELALKSAKTRRRRRRIRAFLSLVERSKMLKNAGLPYVPVAVVRRLAYRREGGARLGWPKKPDVMAPTSVYTAIE